MSNEFQGVTFAAQRITPSDDALIRRAILPDGILSGCAITYSGSTLTMAAGHLMICGRQIRHPASQNWAVVDARTGYARVVLTIDLTQTSTKESFDQVSTALQYADSQDGFASLEQSDINTSGSKYQAVLAMVSLGSGGITGIVSRLKVCKISGSNFKLVGGLTQPADPEEGMIWVATGESAEHYTVASSAPYAPQPGMIWVKATTLRSQDAINLDPSGEVLLTIHGAYRYNGSWEVLPVKVYKSRRWRSVTDYLCCGEYENVGTTGGLQFVHMTQSGSKMDTVKTPEGPQLSYSGKGGSGCFVITGKPLNFSSITTIRADLAQVFIAETGTVVLFATEKKNPGYDDLHRNFVSTTTSGILDLDVTPLQGSFYVGVLCKATYNESGTSDSAVLVRSMTAI